MKVLGIHDGHCSTAALLVDGKITKCVSEERFTNKKNQQGFPKNAINYCLKGFDPNELDLVVLSSKFMAPIYSGEKSESYNFMQKARKSLYKIPFLHDLAYDLVSPELTKKSEENRIQIVKDYLRIPRSKIVTQEHHSAHAFSALYGSGFIKKHKEFLVLTLDGEGDGLCATVNVVKDGVMKRISTTSNAYSLGLLYGEVTRYLGMKINEHEHKIMGLAPYAEEKKVDEVMTLISDLIWVKGMKFEGKIHAHTYQNILQERLKFKRFDLISGAIQKLTENLLVQWIKNGIKETGINNIVCSGGVFMNVKANLKIMEMSEVNDFFVFPSCGDESLAIGSAYYGAWLLKQEDKIEPIKELYLGPDITEEELLKELPLVRLKYGIHKSENIEGEIAELLSRKQIVARCSGRMEWGARALGNRSILADASNRDVVEEINKAIKCRDFYMPFCFVVMKEYEKDYIIKPKEVEASYMILSFNSTDKAKKDLCAAIHPYDKSARPQVIEQSWNPSYYKILKIFKDKTGRGGILNTSFNLHGFPLVSGVKEALYVFENSSLKYLVLNNYLVSKL